MKQFFKFSFIILCSAVIGVLLLATVYNLPIDPIEKNVIESAIIIEEEGVYPTVFDWCTSALDNYTDSIMLTTAAYRGG